MSERLRIGVVDDHEMVRDGICAVIESSPDMEVVAVAGTLEAGIDACRQAAPDVIVVDFQLPDGDGPSIASALKEDLPRTAVLVITGLDERRAVQSAVNNGCAGFVAKGVSAASLLAAVRALSAGAAVFPAELLAAVTSNDGGELGATMTEREHEVLALLAAAKSVAEIAEHLHVSPHTVRNHIRAVLTKLHARSQLEAVVIATRNGLITID